VIRQVLGQGGMGAALLATDKRLDSKQVVIKELVSDSNDPARLKEDEQNFKREVVTLAHLDHPLIPNVTDNFEENSRFFMVQEYVEGENLEDRLERLQQSMQERDVLIYASEILDVLDYLSQQTPPIVHRDIKPANIVISTKDKKAHLVDFGIARADVARNAKRKQTSALGTPGYAPPEQYQGNADPRSDLYALGATLHHLLTNRDPRNFQPFNYPPARTHNAQLAPETESVLVRASHNDIGQRYQSASAMKSDINQILYKRFGIASGALSSYTSSGTMSAITLPGTGGSMVNAAMPASGPVYSSLQAPPPPPPAVSTPPALPPQSPFLPPVPQTTVSRGHAGRNFLLFLLALLLIGAVAFGAFNLTRRSAGIAGSGTPTVGVTTSGIGFTRAADGEYIGISDGTFAFDTSRPDGSLKQQATAALKNGNASQAQGLLQQAISMETNDAEALIYQENQKVLAAGGFHVTIVVATMLTGTNAGVGRDDLQGAYVAQKTTNDGSLLNGIGVVLLIANAGSQSNNAAAVAHQIVQAAKADTSIVGVMGWPYSSYVANTVNIFKAAKLPLVSQTASSDLFTGISPYFFRVCASNKAQGIAGAMYIEQTLHARTAVIFTDPLNAYTSSLANDFAGRFQADGGAILATEKYTVGQTASVASALQSALKSTSAAPDVLYFSGYSTDISTLMTDLPTSGPWGKVQIMGGDALYELSGYQSSAQISWTRVHFTSFTYPDAWDVQGLTAQKPAFFVNYGSDLDPANTHKAGSYGWNRPDGDTILSYDALNALVTAAKIASKSQLTASDLFQALKQLNGTRAFQGVSGQIAFGPSGDPVNKAVVVLYVSPRGFIMMTPTVEGQFLL
jgi:serine/threonine protein kinase/ABC-type branched-subunit amino acid transport system substrate-binding protein